MNKKDPPAGPNWHYRFTPPANIEAFEEALKTLPGVRAIVKHMRGKKSERPHLHVFVEIGKLITKVGIKERLKAHSDLFASLKQRDQWALMPHDGLDTYEPWCTYVCANLSHVIIKSDDVLDKIHDEALKVPIVVDGPLQSPDCPPAIRHVGGTSRMRWDEKICHNAEVELGWKRDGQFTLDQWYTDSRAIQKKVEKHVTQYMRGRFNNNEAIKYARNLLYEFADWDFKEYLDELFFQKISWS